MQTAQLHRPPLRVTGGHEREVTAVCWCPTQPYQLATCSEDSTVCVWNAAYDARSHSHGVLDDDSSPVVVDARIPATPRKSAPKTPSMAASSAATALASPSVPLQDISQRLNDSRLGCGDLASASAAPQDSPNPAPMPHSPVLQPCGSRDSTLQLDGIAGIESGWQMNVSPHRRPRLARPRLVGEVSIADLEFSAPSRHGLAAQPGAVASPARSVDTRSRLTRCG
jgi:WD40 repeat protein